MPDLASLAFTMGMIVSGAGWSQMTRSPEAWPLTIGGYGNRVADLAGYTIVQASTQRAIELAYGWRPYSAVCPRKEIGTCAFERTFTGFDRHGIRHRNLPLIAGIVAASAASVAWRPEGKDDTSALELVGWRILTTSGYVWAGRVAHDWIATWPGKTSPRADRSARENQQRPTASRASAP